MAALTSRGQERVERLGGAGGAGPDSFSPSAALTSEF
jgi:hypothetical protein